MKEIRIPVSKLKTLLMLLGALLFVAAGVWFIADTKTLEKSARYSPILIRLFGGLAILFFGAAAIFALRKLFDPKPALILNEEGIYDNSSGTSNGLIKWEEISGFITANVGGQKLIMVQLHDPDAYLDKVQGAFKKRMLKMNKGIYGTPIGLSANGMKSNYKELLEMLENYWAISKTKTSKASEE